MYSFDYNLCTDKFNGFIHALAVTAAITNHRAFSFVPCAEFGREYGISIPSHTVNFTEFYCAGCGREESACSANPCAGVIADRGDDCEDEGCDECGSLDSANCTCDQLPELGG